MVSPETDGQELRRQLGDLASLGEWGRHELTWYVYRLDADGKKMPPGRAGTPAYVLKFTGTFDLDEVRDQVGGGDFYVMGLDADGVQETRRIRLEGPPRYPHAVAAPNSATPTAPASEASAMLGFLTEQLRQMRQDFLDALRDRAPSGQQLTLADVLAINERIEKTAASRVSQLQPAGGGQALTLEGMFSLMDRLDDRAQRMAESRGGGPTDPIVDLVRDLAPEILDAWRETRGAPAGDAAGASTADQENGGGAERPRARAPRGIDGFTVLGTMLARSIANSMPAEAFAQLAIGILTPKELGTIRMVADEKLQLLLGELARRVEVLASTEAQQYVLEVLGVLRRPPEEAS